MNKDEILSLIDQRIESTRLLMRKRMSKFSYDKNDAYERGAFDELIELKRQILDESFTFAGDTSCVSGCGSEEHN